MIPTPCMCSTPDYRHPTYAASLSGQVWRPGSVIRVGFLDGPGEYRDRVRAHAPTWSEGSGVRFAFVDHGECEIRITFAGPSGRFYSLIGTDALSPGFGTDGHTMALGIPAEWPLGDPGVEREIRRLILHEFGHALGLVHEHSTPEAGSFFRDPRVVYDYYWRTQGWTKAMVDSNVLAVYDRSELGNSTRFDPDSIMLYWFPPEITTRPTGINYEPSALDRQVISVLYPA